jgi:hypothetical protein
MPRTYTSLPRATFRVQDQAVPTTAADIATVSVWIDSMTFANTTAAALTVTVKDKQATPQSFLQAVSIPANSTTIITFPEPKKFIGLNWMASGAGIVGSVAGVQGKVLA